MRLGIGSLGMLLHVGVWQLAASGPLSLKSRQPASLHAFWENEVSLKWRSEHALDGGMFAYVDQRFG